MIGYRSSLLERKPAAFRQAEVQGQQAVEIVEKRPVIFLRTLITLDSRHHISYYQHLLLSIATAIAAQKLHQPHRIATHRIRPTCRSNSPPTTSKSTAPSTRACTSSSTTASTRWTASWTSTPVAPRFSSASVVRMLVSSFGRYVETSLRRRESEGGVGLGIGGLICVCSIIMRAC